MKSLKPGRSVGTGAFYFLILSIVLLSSFTGKAQTAAKSKISVTLLLNTDGSKQSIADGVVAVFADHFSAKIGNEDSYKFENENENIAIDRNGKLLSIEGRPTIKTSDTLHLKMWKLRRPSYHLQITGADFSDGVSAFISDSYLHREVPVDLAGVTMLAFDITADAASYAPGRFSIYFETAAILQVP